MAERAKAAWTVDPARPPTSTIYSRRTKARPRQLWRQGATLLSPWFCFLRGDNGAVQMIAYNCAMVFVPFLLLHRMFPFWEQSQIHAQLGGQLDSQGLWEAGVSDYESYFQWQESLFADWGNSIVTPGGLHWKDPRGLGTRISPFQWHAAHILQKRLERFPPCQAVEALDEKGDAEGAKQLQHMLVGLGVFCDQENATFGKWFNATDQTVQDCPFFPAETTPQRFNPFSRFSMPKPGFSADPGGGTDFREGTYAYRVVDYESMQSLPRLKECSYLDLRSRKVVVSLTFFSVLTRKIGELRYTIFFNGAGGTQTLREMNMAEFATPADAHRSEAVLINLGILHKAIVSGVGVVALVARLTCCPAENKNGQRRKRAGTINKENVCTRLRIGLSKYGMMNVMCDIMPSVICGFYAMSSAAYDFHKIKIFNAMRASGTTLVDEQFDHPLFYEHKDTLMRLLMEGIALRRNFQIVTVLFFICAGVDAFRHFWANTHFSMVPRTLVRSCRDLVYILVTAVAISLVFSEYAVLNYSGLDVKWATPSSALLQSILLFMGEYSDFFDGISGQIPDEERVSFFLIFIAYVLLMLVVVANIFVAIIMDAYSGVQDAEAVRDALARDAKDSGRLAKRIAKKRWKAGMLHALLERKQQQQQQQHGGTSGGGSKSGPKATDVIPIQKTSQPVGHD